MTLDVVPETPTEVDVLPQVSGQSGQQRELRGVSPVLEVPFQSDGTLDLPGFARVVDHALGCGVGSVMFPGYASEFLKLTPAERWQLIEVLLDRTAPAGVVAICAVQDHGTRAAVEHATRLVESGADAINLLPPYLLRPHREEVRDHVLEVAAAVAPHPVVLQYAPEQTGTTLDAEVIAGLALQQPNIALVKVESVPPGPLIEALRRGSPSLPAMVGYAGVQMIDALRRGAVGVQPGCSLTEVYVEIWRRHEAGDFDGAAALHQRLLPYISYWMLDSELIVSAEKLISMRRGLIDSDHCRRPRRQLDTVEVEMVDRLLRDFGDLLPGLSGR